jgi:hypothetical protein
MPDLAVGRARHSEAERADVVQALGLGGEFAHPHVVDHALAQRRNGLSREGDGSAPVGKRGGLPRSHYRKQARCASISITGAGAQPPTARAV